MNISFSFIAAFLLAFISPVHCATVELFAGGGTLESGVATNCALHSPFAVVSDHSGNIYIAEMAGGERVLRVNSNGDLTIIAGTGKKGDAGDGGPAGAATFNGMHNLVLGPDDNLFIADTWNNSIRHLDTKRGLISAFAGNGKKDFGGDDGPALVATFGNVYCLAYQAETRNLYVADLDNRRIRRINVASGIVTTVAGNGERGIPRDGSKATGAPLLDPRAVAIDSHDNLYILERSGHALRKVDRNGIISTVAGTGKKGFEDGDALRASFNEPKHICVDAQDNVIIADTDNHVIRKYLPTENKVIRVAGTGKSGTRLSVSPETVELNQPHGVYVDKKGTLYIADSLNNRVLRLQP